MQIGLYWYAKTPKGWRYFKALFHNVHGVVEARHGWVKDKGQIVEYPQGRYVLRSQRDGKRHFDPVDTCNPREAVRALNTARNAAPRGRNPKVFVKTAVAEYIENLKAKGFSEASQNARVTLAEFLQVRSVRGVQAVRAINEKMVLDWFAVMESKGLSPRTRWNRYMRLRGWLKWCGVPRGFLPPAPRYEKDKVPNTYEPGQIAAIHKAADERMRVIVDLGLMLGLRMGEIAHAEWSDVNWRDRTFTVQGKPHWKWTVKTHEKREIPMSAKLVEDLTAWRERMGPHHRLIVGTQQGKPDTHLMHKFAVIAERAGLNGNGYTLHRLRRTAITTWLQSGIDLRTVQAWAGHNRLSSTERYLRPARTERYRSAIDAIQWDESATDGPRIARKPGQALAARVG
jgi:integrase/recombinase XerC